VKLARDIMKTQVNPWVVWSPRVLAALAAAFLGLFALDALNGNQPDAGLAGFLVHLTPAAIVLVAVALAWSRPWIGALLFAGFAIGYAFIVRRLDWILVISGPLLIVAAAFALSGWYGRRDSRVRLRA
jgi:hypothetical protein